MPDHIEAPGREPGDCGSLGHPAIHATPLSRVRDAFQPNHIRWYATSQSPGSRRGLVWPPVGCRPIRGSRRVSATAVAGSGGSLANAGSHRSPLGASPGTAGRWATPPSMPPRFPGCATRFGRTTSDGTPRRSPPARAEGLYGRLSGADRSEDPAVCPPRQSLEAVALWPMPDQIEAPGREPGDCGSLGHPAIHATPLSRVRDAFRPNHVCWYATSQSPGSRRGLVWPPVGCRPIRGSRRVSATASCARAGRGTRSAPTRR